MGLAAAAGARATGASGSPSEIIAGGLLFRALGTGVALVLACASAVRFANRVPAPLPASAPADVFSADRAMRHVRLIAQTPHPTGSEAHARVRAYLIAELTRLGLAPQVQDVTGIGTRFPVAGRVRNVLARIPGTASTGKAVLIVAHYDGVPAAPAAGDDASSTAAVLETVRALLAGPQPRNDVIALITDAEESGLLGAAAFVRDHPWAKDVGVVLNFEARGTGGPSLMFQTGDGNLDVVRALRSAPNANATSLSTTVYRRLPNDTDLSEFLALGTPALNFAFIHGVTRYHTAEDDVAHLDPASVQHHGEQMLALARLFGSETLPRARTPDAVFFTLPLAGLVIYPESWALPIALLALVLVGWVVVRFAKHEPRWIGGTLIAAGATLITAGICAAIAYATAGALEAFHGGRPMGGDPAWSTTYALALALLVIAIGGATHGLVRRWAGARATHAGALLVWALLAVFVTLVAPGASFVYVWPLTFVAAASVGADLSAPPRLTAARIWLATVIALFVLVPTIYLMVCVALGLDSTGATILALLTSLTVWLLAPHLETMRGARPVVMPIVVAAASAVLFAVGLARERTTPAHPTGASFVYAIDADSGKAWLTGIANPRSAYTWLRQSLPQPSSGQQRRPSWLTRGFDPLTTVAAPFSPQLSAPSVAVLGDSTRDEIRRLTFRIRAAPGTQAVYVTPDSASVLSTLVDGKPVDIRRYRYARRWPLQYVSPSDSGFTLTLELRPGTRPVLGVMSRIETIPRLEGLQFPQRPAGIIPIQYGDVSLVYRRVPVGPERTSTPRR